MQELNDRVVELETKLAFQEELLARLDEVVASQGNEMERMALRIQRLEEQLKEAMPSLIKSEAEETPPPHY